MANMDHYCYCHLLSILFHSIRVKHKIALLLILIFSFFLYTFKLSTIPSSVYVDEATVGVNANLIMSRGVDEYGQSYPIYFRFFNAYTPGLFVYLIIPFIKIFGLNPFALRLLSAISGTISVYFFYKILSIFSKNALVGTVFYAIIPWTVFNSRLGYEVMFAATLFNIGCYFLLKNLSKISYLGLFLISLSTYASHTQRYLAPLFLFGYLIIFKKIKIKPIIFLLITQIPNILMIFTNSFWIKNNNLSLKFFIYQIINYLSPKSLFFNLPDIDLQHQIPSTSVFYWWMIIPLFFGIKKLITLDKKYKKFIILWFISSLIPASLSGEFISIQRALPTLFPLMIIISLGLSTNLFLNIFLFLYSLLLLFRSYFILLPKINAQAWDYGYEQLSKIILDTPNKKYLIDNTRNSRTYILPLFYLNLPYQNKIQNYYSAPTIPNIYSYSNLTFKSLNWVEDLSRYDFIVSDRLSISPDQAVEHKLTKIKTITTPNNTTVLDIYIINK